MIAVVDDNTRDGTILGFATSASEALAVAHARWKSDGADPEREPIAARREKNCLGDEAFSAEINTREEAERALAESDVWVVDVRGDV